MKVRTLLIEDDSVQSAFIASLIGTKALEFDVDIENDWAHGKAALQNNERYDIILLDLILPNGEGVELVRNVIKEARGTPILVVTSSDDPTIFKACAEAGVDGFLHKSKLDRIELSRAMYLAALKAEKRQEELKVVAWNAKMAILKKLAGVT